jgi:hypothetical protein
MLNADMNQVRAVIGKSTMECKSQLTEFFRPGASPFAGRHHFAENSLFWSID